MWISRHRSADGFPAVLVEDQAEDHKHRLEKENCLIGDWWITASLEAIELYHEAADGLRHEAAPQVALFRG